MIFHCGGRLHLDAAVEAGVFHALEQFAGAIGGIAVDRRGLRRPGLRAIFGIGTGQHIGEEILSGFSVPAVARCDPGGGNDLRIRVNGDMAFIAVEAAGKGVVSVQCLRVNGGDDPVRGDPARYPEHPGRVLLQVLAGHGGQQRRGLRQRRAQLPPVQHASSA